MSDFIGIIVVIVAFACMYLAQRSTTPRASKRMYSLLGSIASTMVAIEAGRRSEAGVMILFVGAAGIGLLTLVLDYLKPSNR